MAQGSIGGRASVLSVTDLRGKTDIFSTACIQFGKEMDEVAGIIRVLIADDHPLFRIGVRKYLEAAPGMEVIGEASDGPETIRLVAALQPDVLLLDLRMPGCSGMEVLQQLLGTRSSLRIVLFAAVMEKPQMIEALHLGAQGLLLKEAATELLVQCIQTVVAGRYWVGREAAADLAQSLRLLPVDGAAFSGPRGKPKLTPREMDIVSLIASGLSNTQIAQRLSLSEWTVKHHLSSIFKKFGVSNRLEVALLASPKKFRQ